MEARIHSKRGRSWESQDKIRGSAKNGLTASEVRDYVKDNLYHEFLLSLVNNAITKLFGLEDIFAFERENGMSKAVF